MERVDHSHLPSQDKLSEVALWCALIVVTPLAFLPIAAHPFEPPKAAIVAAVCPGLAAVGLQRRGIAIGVPRLPLVLVGGFAVVVVTAAAFGIDVNRSLFGSQERAAGVITWLALLTVVPGVISLTAGARQRASARLAAAVCFSAAIPSLYGIGQWFGLDAWEWAGDAVSPVAGTLGRSNFLGDLIAMAIPLCVALLLAEFSTGRELSRTEAGPPRHHVSRFVVPSLGGLLVLYAVALGLTLARAAWIGAACGALSTVILMIAPSRFVGSVGRAASSQYRWLAALALGVIGAATLLAVSPGPWDSTGARLTAWRWTAWAWLDRPWLGYGPDALELVLPTLWSGSRVDRAHNLVLDMAAQFGAAGALLYLTLLGGLMAAVLAAVGNRDTSQCDDETANGLCSSDAQTAHGLSPSDAQTATGKSSAAISAPVAGAVGALVAFVVSGMFSFGTVTTWLIHWVAVGILLTGLGWGRQGLEAPVGGRAMGGRRSGKTGDPNAVRSAPGPLKADSARPSDVSRAGQPDGSPSRLLSWGAVRAGWAAALLVLSAIGAFWGVTAVTADIASGTASRSAADSDMRAAVRWSERASALAPYRPELDMMHARWALTVANLEGSTPGALLAAARAGSAASASPHDAYLQLAAGEVQLAGARATGLPPLFVSAETSLRAALAQDPRLVEARTTLGQLAMAQDNPRLAAANFRAALAIDEAHAPSHAGLGWAELSLGNLDAAADAFARALVNDPDSVDAAFGHAISLCRVGKRAEGRLILDRVRSSADGADEPFRAAAVTACRFE